MALGGLTALRLGVAAVTPLAPDEAYYWVWSHALAPGYVDHPPMVALWIRAGRALAGETALGVRLLSPFAAALGTLLVAGAARDLLGAPRAGVVAAVLFNATLLCGVGAVTATPDTPLLLFWTATLWALGRVYRTGHGAWWLAAGVAGGLALTSKYTAGLLAPCVLVWLGVAPAMRPWLLRWQPWAAAALAGLMFSPVVVWNDDHAYVSLWRQGGRVADWDLSRALGFEAELVGGQFGFATPGLAVLFVAGAVMALRRWSQPGSALLAIMIALPGLVFVQHALGDRVQANWPAVLYPAAAIAAAGLGPGWNRLRGPAVVLGLVLTAMVWVQGAAAPVALSRDLDPTLMRVGGWQGLADALAAIARREGAEYVASDNYGHAALLAWSLPPGLPGLGVDPRWSLFRLPDARASIDGRVGLLIRSTRRADPLDASDWATVTPLPDLDRRRGGVTAETFRLYRVTGRVGTMPLARLPGRHRPEGGG